MAGETGLEPAASGVTGRRYNQLNYSPVEILKCLSLLKTGDVKAQFVMLLQP